MSPDSEKKRLKSLKVTDCNETYLGQYVLFLFTTCVCGHLYGQVTAKHYMFHSLHPTYHPGDNVSPWISTQCWQLQMLLTVVKLRGSSSHSKVQMFLFSFPCFG